MYGEIICQQGFGPKTDISMHDMIRFDLLQFLVYLTDSSDGSLYPETRFLHEYLGQYFTLESLMRFKQDRTATPEFVTTIPRSLTYFVEADQSGLSACTNERFFKVKESVQPVCRTRSGIHFLQQPDNRHRSLRADGLYRYDRGIPAQTETV